MIVSFIDGLPKLIGSDFQGAQTFPFEISKTPLTALTEEVLITDNVELSIWIKLPNRQIESKNFTVSVSFEPADKSQSVELRKKFGLWHTRSSFGQGQYYKIGAHRFANGFVGKLLIVSEGKWRPGYDASIVLRKNEESLRSILLPPVLFFISGAFLIVLGVFVIRGRTKGKMGSSKQGVVNRK